MWQHMQEAASALPAGIKTTPRPLKGRAAYEQPRSDPPSPAKERPKTPQPPAGPPPAAIFAARHHGIPQPRSAPGSSGKLVDFVQPPWKRARHGSPLHGAARSHRQDCRHHLVKRTCPRLSITTCSINVKQNLNWDPDLIIDMRCFWDPNATAALKEHDGRNDTIVERMVRHPQFEEWLSSLKKRLEEHLIGAEKARKPEVRVVTFCRAGQHRAVAGSVILSSLAQKLGLPCEPPRHLTARLCRCPCCQGHSQRKLDVLESVWERWNNL